MREQIHLQRTGSKEETESEGILAVTEAIHVRNVHPASEDLQPVFNHGLLGMLILTKIPHLAPCNQQKVKTSVTEACMCLFMCMLVCMCVCVCVRGV